MENKKYEILEDNFIIEKTSDGREIKLYRIKALKDFEVDGSHGVKRGDIGGYIESESNLSQESNSWIHDDAKVYGGSTILASNVYIEDNAVLDNVKNVKYASGVIISDNVYIKDSEIIGGVFLSDNVKVINSVISVSRCEKNVYIENSLLLSCVVRDNVEISTTDNQEGKSMFINCNFYDNVHIKGNFFIKGMNFEGDMNLQNDGVEEQHFDFSYLMLHGDGTVNNLMDDIRIFSAQLNGVHTTFVYYKNTGTWQICHMDAMLNKEFSNSERLLRYSSLENDEFQEYVKFITNFVEKK